MKKILSLFLFIGFIVAGCNDNNQEQIKNDSNEVKTEQNSDDVSIQSDSVNKGDIFVTTGPAGKMEKKEGRIVMIAESGKTLPIKMIDNVLFALIDSTGTTYRVKTNGDKTVLVMPDSDKVLQDGKMLFITDSGEKMEVKMLDEKMVVITAQNTMLTLEKLE